MFGSAENALHSALILLFDLYLCPHALNNVGELVGCGNSYRIHVGTNHNVCRLFMQFAQLLCGETKFFTTLCLQILIATCILIIAVACLPSSSVTKDHFVEFSDAPSYIKTPSGLILICGMSIVLIDWTCQERECSIWVRCNFRITGFTESLGQLIAGLR